MALEGYLEDLGFRDILQLLSLSKKSGTLTLKCRRGEGVICFSQGQIIRASSSLLPQGLGQLLRKEKLVSAEQVNRALAYQQASPRHCPFGRILTELFQVPKQDIERVVARQIERIVFSFFSWQEGTFAFQLEPLSVFGEAQLNPLDYMLEKGLSPQHLLVKGRKIIDQGETRIDERIIEREVREIQAHQREQGIDLLKSMLAELQQPEFGGGIILLILRYASEIMGRAIIFDVRGKLLVGLGQFGLKSAVGGADSLVRKLRLQVEPDSFFARVLDARTAALGALNDTAAERDLQRFLAGAPQKVFLAPLLNENKVVALLYGDGFSRHDVSRRLEVFKVFLSRAGLAMEQALQEKGA